ncbi:putative HTH-type transcriptional regulator [Abditibacteriota bacterium]|nr:putative HTH-type transcriptional regulator [Abditibacteriota bacterium]
MTLVSMPRAGNTDRKRVTFIKMAQDVFISYSSKDKQVTDAVCAALEVREIPCWMAPRDILPGTDWSEAILEAIVGSRIVVLVFSSASNDSPQVKREIERAIHHRINIIPFRVENILPSGAMEYFLSTPHWLDAFEHPIEQHIETLTVQVQRLLSRNTVIPAKVPDATTPLPQVQEIPLQTTNSEQTGQRKAVANNTSTNDEAFSNVPQSFTPFIGRVEQLQEWSALLLQPTTRLITIAGFGGMGKTRTALEIARRCRDDFGDGVWWVTLETATTGEEMIHRIAEQLRLHLKPQPTVREQLWDFHRDRDLLLVLDNLEQIRGTEASEVVQGLLNAGARVKCLVTSRRSLEISAEQLVELEPMPFRDAEALFVERARARKANFALTTQNATTVTDICHVLEGLPLAIEIAASLIVLLSPPQILKRLDDQLRLTTRDPGVPRRQQALRAAIDWSYDLLTEGTKTIFAQLSAFTGGFVFDAAEAICSGQDVLGSLLELRSFSLLRVETNTFTQQERLLMLRAVADYAAEKLSDSEVRRRHAEYFCIWAQDRAQLLRTPEEAEVLDELEAEFDNLRAAINWAAKHDPSLCANLALIFHQPLHLLGFWAEARGCLEKGWRALQQTGNESRSLYASLQFQLASLAHDAGDLANAKSQAQANLTAYRELQDSSGTARALNLLGLLATEAQDVESARCFLNEALALWPKDDEARFKTLNNLARLSARQGNTEEARRLYEEILAHRRSTGDLRGQAVALGNLGALSLGDMDYIQARRLYAESLQLWRALRDPLGTAVAINNLGELAVLDNNTGQAVTLFVHAERLFQELRSPYAEEPAQALQRLKVQEGAAEYEVLRQTAEQMAWEDVV